VRLTLEEVTMAMYQNPIRINLMPHREVLKETRKKTFFTRMLLSALLGLALMTLAWQFVNNKISAQKARNDFIITQTKILDEEIKQIATLQAEIDALKARQKAVEDLQADRNLPVYIFQELTSFVPEGVYLKNIKQDSKRIIITGVAQTQEKISEMLRNFSNASVWLEKPELIESKLLISNAVNPKNSDKLYEFTVAVIAKRDKKQLPVVPGSAVPTSAISANAFDHAASRQVNTFQPVMGAGQLPVVSQPTVTNAVVTPTTPATPSSVTTKKP
jgi:type IV pilus assembly protein PilN